MLKKRIIRPWFSVVSVEIKSSFFACKMSPFFLNKIHSLLYFSKIYLVSITDKKIQDHRKLFSYNLEFFNKSYTIDVTLFCTQPVSVFV
ncbi:hypothetical protein EDB96_1986 [Flavobacterium sp. S87F.05.LMB.W.Kidney.N]|nr:hypothetical protein EDB96_1986 [Flavobacterium sp. S87F.05.LMB.W.Kidney.N]